MSRYVRRKGIALQGFLIALGNYCIITMFVRTDHAFWHPNDQAYSCTSIDFSVTMHGPFR